MDLITKYIDISSGRLADEIAKVSACFDALEASDFAGWLDYASGVNARVDLERVIKAAEYIRENSEVFLVVGIGGSYLGSKAVIDALLPNFVFCGGGRTEVVYAGQNLSAEYIAEVLEIIRSRECCVNIVSKSGTTVESDIAARFVISEMKEKYGDEYRLRVFVTTDETEGVLRSVADAEGYTSFSIPRDIGGRFSVFTPVGLLPAAVAGVDVSSFLDGAISGEKLYLRRENTNPALIYAALRNYLDVESKEIELFAVYEPRHTALASWWVQLFGESCGKDGVGLFPAQACYTTDLHSIGQLVQEGRRNLFETVLWCDSDAEIAIPALSEEWLAARGGTDYLGGRTVSEIGRAAYTGTMTAHTEGGVPCIGIELKKNNELNLGELMYFFMVSASLAALSQGLNPFDQPGVEAYKRSMREILTGDR